MEANSIGPGAHARRPGLERGSLPASVKRVLATASWPEYAAAAVSVVGCLLLLAQAGDLLTALYRNADNAVTIMLPASFPTGSLVQLGNHPFFEAWWFMRATAGLPGHLWLWQAAPFVVTFAGIAVTAWCAKAVGGRAGAVICVAGLVSMSPALRAVLLVPEARVGLPLHAAVLCAALLLIDRHSAAGRMTQRRWILAGIAITVFTSAGATDELLFPAAIGPYLAAALLCWWVDRSARSGTLVRFALITALASLCGSLLIAKWMTASGVSARTLPLHATAIGGLRDSLRMTLRLFAIVGGDGLTPAGWLAIGGLIGTIVAVARAATRIVPGPINESQRARVVFVAFWACALLLSLGAVAATSVSAPDAVYNAAERYLLGAWFALVALLAAGATTAVRRNGILIGVALFGVFNLQSNLATVNRPWEYGPPGATQAAIQRFVLSHGARVGYGDYWDVMPMRLAAAGRLQVVPILELGRTGTWARQDAAGNTAWFQREPNRGRSFLVTDSRPLVTYAPRLPPAAFGRPMLARRFGPLTVYVYPYDLFGRLHGELI